MNMTKFLFVFRNTRGTTLIMALVFLSILSIVSTSIVGAVIAENKLAKVRLTEEYSFQVAEAGLQYGRWRLAHNASDLASETKTLTDFAGGDVGSYTLTFTPPSGGDPRIGIRSNGWYGNETNLYRTVAAKYGKRVFTYYAFLFDEGAWFSIPSVSGRVHSNGGIRMDATASAPVSSGVASYTCAKVHGCGTNQTKAGIWGAGGNQSLWSYPVVPIDFASVITDLQQLHELAEDNGVGLFLTKNGIPKGYELNFLPNGTVEVYKITSLTGPVQHNRWKDGVWKNYSSSLDIDNRTLLQTYTLQPNDFIFAESDVWVRGTVKGRVTVVAAEIPQESSNYQNIVISDNVVYNTYDGSTTLGLIAKGNILISLKVPDNLRVDGVLMAQTGIVGRDYYEAEAQIAPYHLRASITTYGSIVSKAFSDPQFRWIDEVSGNVISGFVTSTNLYDQNVAYNAPPYFPTAGGDNLMEWEEKVKGI